MVTENTAVTEVTVDTGVTEDKTEDRVTEDKRLRKANINLKDVKLDLKGCREQLRYQGLCRRCQGQSLEVA